MNSKQQNWDLNQVSIGSPPAMLCCLIQPDRALAESGTVFQGR